MEQTPQLLAEEVAALTASRPAAPALEPGMAQARLGALASAPHVAEPRPQAVRERPEAVLSEAVQRAQVTAALAPSAARWTRREAVLKPSKPES